MAVLDRDGGGTCFYRHTLWPTGSILPGIALPKVTILVGLLPRLEVIQPYCQFLQVRKAAYMDGQLNCGGNWHKPPNLFLLVNNISLTAKAVK